MSRQCAACRAGARPDVAMANVCAGGGLVSAQQDKVRALTRAIGHGLVGQEDASGESGPQERLPAPKRNPGIRARKGSLLGALSAERASFDRRVKTASCVGMQSSSTPAALAELPLPRRQDCMGDDAFLLVGDSVWDTNVASSPQTSMACFGRVGAPRSPWWVLVEREDGAACCFAQRGRARVAHQLTIIIQVRSTMASSSLYSLPLLSLSSLLHLPGASAYCCRNRPMRPTRPSKPRPLRNVPCVAAEHSIGSVRLHRPSARMAFLAYQRPATREARERREIHLRPRPILSLLLRLSPCGDLPRPSKLSEGDGRCLHFFHFVFERSPLHVQVPLPLDESLLHPAASHNKE